MFNAVLAPLIVAAVLGLAGWGWWLHAGHAEQENHLTNHDGQFATRQWDSDRILAKLDEILRELRPLRDVVADVDELVRLGEIVAPSSPGNVRVLGAAQYRAGRYELTIKRFDD